MRLSLRFSVAVGAAGSDGCDAGMGIVGEDEGGPTGAQVSVPVRIDPSLAHIPFHDAL